eukprot:CAMPEP_0117553276 /NCGR_PEP_ID=MMETSP0784-20121206/50141_1 /TAXON_ID=39447 /ORGANISM="" /LENGTH=113 /DNA_ID=CAMNT_0005350377 /DNA_START=51 /DNA_END=389 /DNA_ORIENTATION=-
MTAVHSLEELPMKTPPSPALSNCSTEAPTSPRTVPACQASDTRKACGTTPVVTQHADFSAHVEGKASHGLPKAFVALGLLLLISLLAVVNFVMVSIVGLFWAMILYNLGPFSW